MTPTLMRPLSGLGELHAAALAGEKLYTELGFKLGDLARNGRLGDVQGAGGGGNAASLRDRAEVFELANGHEKVPPDELY